MYIGVYLSRCSTRLRVPVNTRIKQPEVNYHRSVEITSVRGLFTRGYRASFRERGDARSRRSPQQFRRKVFAACDDGLN